MLVEGGRAVGVVARALRDGERTLTVRARAVVVACGSLLTPLLLETNGLGDALGPARQQPVDPPGAGRDGAVRRGASTAGNAIPQGYAIEEFHDEGILFEGAFAPLDVGARRSPMIGPTLDRACSRTTTTSPASAS